MPRPKQVPVYSLHKNTGQARVRIGGKPPATAGKKHHVVAANDGGLISLTVDGKKVFEYKDTQPLKGDRYGQIGFYTYGSTLKIENLMVSKKDAPAAPASK